MTYPSEILKAISAYSDALTKASREVSAITEHDIGVCFVPVVWQREVIGVLNREVTEHDFEFIPITNYESAQLQERLGL